MQQFGGGVRNSAPPLSSQRQLNRTEALPSLYAVVLAFLAVGLFFGRVDAAPDAQTQAGLVIVHGDGRVVTRCVDFQPSEISGYELLQSSGLDLGIEASSMGASICRIDGQGCSPPGQSCFCQCVSSPCKYWSYWRLQADGWGYSNLGASSNIVRAGDVDAWVWGEGIIGRDAASAPPSYSFDDICAPPTPSPTATMVATDTPVPTSTVAAPTISTATPTATPTWTVASIPAATYTPVPTADAGSSPALNSTPTAPLPAISAPTHALTPTPTSTWTPASVEGSEGTTKPQVREFRVEPTQIDFGESATLIWAIEHAGTVRLRHGAGEEMVASVGSLAVSPALTDRYTLIAQNALGETEATLLLFVRPVHMTPTPVSTLPSPDFNNGLDVESGLDLAESRPGIVESEPEAIPIDAIETDWMEQPLAPESVAQVDEEQGGGVPSDALFHSEAGDFAADATEVEPTGDSAHLQPPSQARELLETIPTGEPIAQALPAISVPAPDRIQNGQVDEGGLSLQSSGQSAAVEASIPDQAGDPARESARLYLLALATGSVFVLGAPLLFASILALLWFFWRGE